MNTLLSLNVHKYEYYDEHLFLKVNVSPLYHYDKAGPILLNIHEQHHTIENDIAALLDDIFFSRASTLPSASSAIS